MKKNLLYPFLITIISIIIVFLAFENLEAYFTDKLNALSKHPFQFAIVSFVILIADIVLPVPSSIVMYVNGYVLGIPLGGLISLISLSIGSVIGYYLGKLSSLGLRAQSDERSHAILSKYGALAILMTRGIPIVSESICIVCGYNGMPLKQYFIFNLIGYLPLCLLYAFCGSIGFDKNNFLISFACSLFISASFWFLGKAFVSDKKRVIVD